jgi:hypothetical protein
MHMAAHAGCELVAVAPITTSQQGYAVMTFAVRTEAEAHLVNFIQSAGAALGMTHWYGVPEDYFTAGKPLYIELLPDDIRSQWLNGLNAYGWHNEEVRIRSGENT